MTEKAYHYDYIQLYGTRTSASDEAVVIFNEKALMYMLSLLNVKLVIYYYNEVRMRYSFLITSSMKRNIHSLIFYNLE